MRVRNLAKTTKTIISNGNSFSGTVDGQTYTATKDKQLLRLWGNIVLPVATDGMCTAIVEDVHGDVNPTKGVTFKDGMTSSTCQNLWDRGLVMSAGAQVTLRCRAKISDEDWRVMQVLGVGCFDKDTAIY